jgi:hypothetical protein
MERSLVAPDSIAKPYSALAAKVEPAKARETGAGAGDCRASMQRRGRASNHFEYYVKMRWQPYRICLAAPDSVVRVWLYKNTGDDKLPDVDNVKGGALAAT